MPYRDPFPNSTAADTLPRRFQEIELKFGNSSVGISVPVVPTASLPAVSTARNGTVLVENAGTSHCLIVYLGTERIRVVGTTF